MSYSFSARGATKIAVMANVGTELDKVVAAQPVHAADRQQAIVAAKVFLDILPDDAGDKDFYVSLSGSLGWDGTLDKDHVLISAGVNVSASMVVKEKAAA